jgi:hypothetical protein
LKIFFNPYLVFLKNPDRTGYFLQEVLILEKSLPYRYKEEDTYRISSELQVPATGEEL